jgi:hypothetical protein
MRPPSHVVLHHLERTLSRRYFRRAEHEQPGGGHQHGGGEAEPGADQGAAAAAGDEHARGQQQRQYRQHDLEAVDQAAGRLRFDQVAGAQLLPVGPDLLGAAAPGIAEAVVAVSAGSPVAKLRQPRPHLIDRHINSDGARDGRGTRPENVVAPISITARAVTAGL